MPASSVGGCRRGAGVADRTALSEHVSWRGAAQAARADALLPGRGGDLALAARAGLQQGRQVLQGAERVAATGRVRGGHVIINGQVNGPIQSDELLELQPQARIVGDVRYEVLEMHQGATIDGELRPLKAEEKPSLKLAASNLG